MLLLEEIQIVFMSLVYINFILTRINSLIFYSNQIETLINSLLYLYENMDDDYKINDLNEALKKKILEYHFHLLLFSIFSILIIPILILIIMLIIFDNSVFFMILSCIGIIYNIIQIISYSLSIMNNVKLLINITNIIKNPKLFLFIN
tara:strand:- start:160 stop:603 length:444 start_codon:yes stop_codon:yes gene_type:complete